jgi:hypothetical protein
MNVKQTLEIFAEQNLVDASQFEDLEHEVAQSGKSLVQVLVDYGIVTEEQFYQVIAESLGVD